MKRLVTLLLLALSINFQIKSQSIGIGTPTPHPSAAFEIDASDKGLLISRMTSTQRIAISSPAEGLIVFDTSTKTFWFFHSTWIEIKKDNLGDHTATQDLDMDGQRIMNLDDPVIISDAATKFYVDNHTDGDADANNEIQALSLSNDTIYLSSGGFVKLPPSAGAFENDAGLIRNPGSNQNDFIFGNQNLPQNGSTTSERFFFFDEDIAAFRAGRLQNSNYWSPDSLGN